VAGLLALVTIVGIPWAKACFVIGQFAFFPFAKVAISRKDLSKRDDIGTGALGFLGNVIWFIFAGVWPLATCSQRCCVSSPSLASPSVTST
jgi:uncharacterized membrane protein YccF (DUF307 family)